MLFGHFWPKLGPRSTPDKNLDSAPPQKMDFWSLRIILAKIGPWRLHSRHLCIVANITKVSFGLSTDDDAKNLNGAPKIWFFLHFWPTNLDLLLSTANIESARQFIVDGWSVLWQPLKYLRRAETAFESNRERKGGVPIWNWHRPPAREWDGKTFWYENSAGILR